MDTKTLFSVVVAIILVVLVLVVTQTDSNDSIFYRVGNSLIKRPRYVVDECSTEYFIHKDSDLFMYEIDNEVVGYCAYLPKNKNDNDYIFIYWICIGNQHRGKGIGKAFMLDMMKTFREEGYAYVELVSTREKREFYKSLGFVEQKQKGVFRYYY